MSDVSMVVEGDEEEEGDYYMTDSGFLVCEMLRDLLTSALQGKLKEAVKQEFAEEAWFWEMGEEGVGLEFPDKQPLDHIVITYRGDPIEVVVLPNLFIPTISQGTTHGRLPTV